MDPKYTEVEGAEIALIALKLGKAMKEFDRFGYCDKMGQLLRDMKVYSSIFEPVLSRCKTENPNFAKYNYKIPY